MAGRPGCRDLRPVGHQIKVSCGSAERNNPATRNEPGRSVVARRGGLAKHNPPLYVGNGGLRFANPSYVHARTYFANAGNTGNLSTSRASCWMMTVAFRFAAIFFRRSIEATVWARSKLNHGTPSES